MARIVVLSRAGQDSLPAAAVKALQVQHDVRFVQCTFAPGADEAAELLADADVLASTNVTLPVLDAALLERLPRLRQVVLYATGYEHLDLSALTAAGVTVTTLPEYATNAVAEHALGLIFASATRVHLANDKARGRTPYEVSLRGVEVTKRTLAIVGTGRIGRRLAELARGLGMRVVGVDIDPAAAAAAAGEGIVMMSKDAALREADLVAICASTIAGTYPILAADDLAVLHPDVFVVNVGRPVLVDQDDVRTALLERALRGYAVDEIAFDPSQPLDALLLEEGRVLQTAHSAWWRDEVLARGAQMFATAIQSAADGAPIDVVAARHPSLVAAS